ncbi:MAG: UbiD family decarboxylase, partial [Deltaproteobacteria bacterium]|nr:UbiD family decarboxylase [Deltaproteobacteria bacterium]
MDLRDFISKCEAAGKLKRVKKEVDWNLELSHISKINEEKDGGALLFENVKGYKNSVLTGAYSTKENLAIALGLPLGTSMCEMSRHWMQLAIKKTYDPVVVKDGPILENIIERDKINLFEVPVPQMYPQDGGRFIGTAATLITKDPESGWVNLGTYRMQILDDKSAGIQIIKGKHADFMMK